MQTMQSMQDSTLKLGKGMQDTTLMLGKGMLTATVQTTVGAGNMFVDAAHKTNKSISSLVHDAAAVALDREDDGPEAHEEPPAPLYVPSSWEKKDNMHVVSKQEVSFWRDKGNAQAVLTWRFFMLAGVPCSLLLSCAGCRKRCLQGWLVYSVR
eukprot:1758904-Rhodomonas_salina.1